MERRDVNALTVCFFGVFFFSSSSSFENERVRERGYIMSLVSRNGFGFPRSVCTPVYLHFNWFFDQFQSNLLKVANYRR